MTRNESFRPKHDTTGSKGRFSLSTMDTAMGKRLFVWDTGGNNLGMMSWAKAFSVGIFGPAHV